MPLKIHDVIVTGLNRRASRGLLTRGTARYPVALGRSGRRASKREGDGATPIGAWRAVGVLYRADRVARPHSVLPIARITPVSGWCDAPADRNYNRPVRLPYPASAEALWRDDHLYDVLVILDHNRRPRVRELGSAIFMHCASDGMQPTAGCIALARRQLVAMLAWLRTGQRIVIR